MDIKRIMILDTTSLINKAYYTLPQMISPSGSSVGALFGLASQLFEILSETSPDYIVAAFDQRSPKFFQSGKSNSKANTGEYDVDAITASPHSLSEQLVTTKALLEAFQITMLEKEDWTTIDIIGTVLNKLESEGMEATVITADKKVLQLVSDLVKVRLIGNTISETKLYDLQEIKNEFGLKPEQLPDWNALAGTSTVRFEQILGIGPKMARRLIEELGTIENIYQDLNQVEAVSLRAKLAAGRSKAFDNKKNGQLNRQLPIEISVESLRTRNRNETELASLFSMLGFHSLLEKLDAAVLNNIRISSMDNEKQLPLRVYESEVSILDGIKTKQFLNFIFVFDGKELKGMVIDGGIFVDQEKICEFKEILENRSIQKNTNEAKSAYNWLAHSGIKLQGLEFDASIASYLLNPSENGYELITILTRYSSLSSTEIEEMKSSDSISIARSFVNQLPRIKDNMLSEIEKYDMIKLFAEVEMPLIEVLSYMEQQGFKIDRNTLGEIGFLLSEDIDRLTAEIYDVSGEEFNINSPKQLGVVLFEKLGLPVIKKTKTGYSTDAEVLEDLSGRHEIIEKILNYRQLVKLKSTYIDGLLHAIDKDGRIHSSFNQTITATGRISSTEPNMQNIPVKLEQGKQIRRAFIPDSKDYVILSADYSQIELRVLADIADDQNMIEAFRNNIDIHTKTASEVFGVPLTEVTSLMRSRAKAVNFGIVYGLSDYGLSKDIKTSIKEAKQYIENYFTRYQGVKSYLEKAIAEGKENGYVKTMMNRIRFIPEINSSNRNIKMFGERLAMNTPIQGTAADIIKIAMVNVYRRMIAENLKSKLILQVHDELVLNVHIDELTYVKQMIKQEMEGALKLDVPLLVDVKWGNSWYEAK